MLAAEYAYLPLPLKASGSLLMSPWCPPDCREVSSRRRALAAEEQSERSGRAQQEAEQARRLVEKEREDRTAECLSWREKHRALENIFRAQEDLKAQRRNKAVSHSSMGHHRKKWGERFEERPSDQDGGIREYKIRE